MLRFPPLTRRVFITSRLHWTSRRCAQFVGVENPNSLLVLVVTGMLLLISG